MIAVIAGIARDRKKPKISPLIDTDDTDRNKTGAPFADQSAFIRANPR
jgi:hypothetical protein